MKKYAAIVFILFITTACTYANSFGGNFSSMPPSIAAGIAAGISAATVSASAISQPYNHPGYYRDYAYHFHDKDCPCEKESKFESRYDNWEYPGYINYTRRKRQRKNKNVYKIIKCYNIFVSEV